MGEKKVKPLQQLQGNTVQPLRDLANCAGKRKATVDDVSEFKPHRKGSGYNTQSCCPELAFRPCSERLIRGQETSLQHGPGLTLG